MMNQRILIVDGHPVYVKKVIGFLEGLTFQNIGLAETGRKGLDEIKANVPDLVIISSVLPDMDSLEVCKEIHRMTNAATKIIVQTGLFIDASDIELFKANGAHAVLERKEKDLLPLQKAIEELVFSDIKRRK